MVDFVSEASASSLSPHKSERISMDKENTVIPRKAWLTLAVSCVASFMIAIEVSIISLALPQLRAGFPEASETKLSWVVNAYTIGVASLLLVSGWLADRFGRKKLFFGGLFIFFLASFAAALSPSSDFLITARVFQAIGGAMQYPAGLALLFAAFPPSRIQTAIGIWGATGGLAAALGPTAGALLVDAFDWRAVFFINVPVAALVLILGPRWVEESTSTTISSRVDLFSVPLASIGVGTAIFAITQGNNWGWGSPSLLVSFIIAVVLILAFVTRSRRHPEPLFDLGLFKLHSFKIGSIGTVFFIVAFFSWLISLPTFLQGAWGWSVLKTGFAIAPGPFLCAFLSPIGGRLAERVGNGPLLTLGGLFGAAGLVSHVLFTTLEPDFVKGVLLPGLLIGVGAAFGFAQLIGVTMRDVHPDQFGMGGAGRTTIFQLSLALGVALAFTIVGRPSTSGEVLDGLQVVWLMGIGCYLVQVVIFGLFSFTSRELLKRKS
jgi:EmrB/QacA subfamily drug resistance transporter